MSMNYGQKQQAKITSTEWEPVKGTNEIIWFWFGWSNGIKKKTCTYLNLYKLCIDPFGVNVFAQELNIL